MMVDTDQWVSSAKFSKIVGVSYQLVSYYIRTDRLKSIKIGRDRFIAKECIEEWPPQKMRMGRPVTKNHQPKEPDNDQTS